MRKRIFVYEYLSAGGPVDAGGEKSGRSELLPLGLSMRDAMLSDLLRDARFEVSVASGAAVPAELGHAAPVRPRAGEPASEFVARQAALHELSWVVAPETGGLLAQLHRAVGPARWLGCDEAAIRLTSAKRATLMHLSAAGVVTPLAFEQLPEVSRWVVKPDDGAGGFDTRLHRSQELALEDWRQRSRAGSPMAIEPWVDGEALSLSLLCRARRTELLSINRQRIAIDAQGMLSYDGVDVNAIAADSERGRALARLADQVAGAIAGLRGFVGIDLVWHPRRGPVVIEVNPRVTCAYVGLSAALGRNLAVELVAGHA
jgi:predicted ATP-grasp superfamily ATP-dependent carboligase